MVVGGDTSRVAGLAVSLGIGLGIFVGGLGEATADTGDTSTSTDSGGTSTSTDSAGTDGPATRSRGAINDDDTADGPAQTSRQESEAESLTRGESAEVDDLTEDRPARRDRVQMTSRGAQPDRSPEISEDDAAPSEEDNDPIPDPAQAQAVAVMVTAARRQSQDDAAAPINPPRATSNALPVERDSARDRGRLTAAATATNAPPTLTASVDNPDPLSGVTQVTVTASAPDGDALSYTATRPIFGRVADEGAGNFIYTPTMFARVLARFLPFLRSDPFSVTATDIHGGTAAVKVNTTIVPINSAPRARAVTVNAPSTSTGVVTGKAAATDPNFDSLTFLAATSITAKGSVSVHANGTFTYTPTAAARHHAAAVAATAADKTDTFAVTVSDKFGASTNIAVTVHIGPANSAPTGTTHVDEPDPSIGSVSGTITGFDPDGDILIYRGPTSTLKGSVVVGPDGTFTYTPTATAQYYAAHPDALPYDKSDSFDISIDDGHGGLTNLPVSVVISPGDQPVSVPPLSTFCGCTLLPADTIFHADLRGLPAMPESETWIELLGGSRGATLRAVWAGNEWMGSTGGMPVNVVDSDHPTEDVVFNRGYSTTGPGIDDRSYAIPHRPLVEGMPSYPAWDRHLLVFQKETCISQELYNVANGVELPGAGIRDILGNAAYAAIWGSRWIAEAGAQYDMSSPLYPAIGHANASRLPYLPMILRPDDLERGHIDHMLGISIAKDVGAGYTWPARAGDGSASDGIPMGTVLRLRSDVDINQYAQSTQTVLRALQVHGAVVFDSKGPGTDGASLLAMSNGWSGTDYATAKSELNTIPIDLFEAVDGASLAADPTTGWQVR